MIFATNNMDSQYVWCNDHSELHSIGDNPAMIHNNGGCVWKKNGKMHRDYDLPAYLDGNKYIWFINNVNYRANGRPSYIDLKRGWFVWTNEQGKIHRFLEPAIIKLDEKIMHYYDDGVLLKSEVCVVHHRDAEDQVKNLPWAIPRLLAKYITVPNLVSKSNSTNTPTDTTGDSFAYRIYDNAIQTFRVREEVPKVDIVPTATLSPTIDPVISPTTIRDGDVVRNKTSFEINLENMLRENRNIKYHDNTMVRLNVSKDKPKPPKKQQRGRPVNNLPGLNLVYPVTHRYNEHNYVQ